MLKIAQHTNDKKPMQCFLGVTNYLKKLVPIDITITCPLCYLKNNANSEWTDNCEKVFEWLTNILSEIEVLCIKQQRHQIVTR